MKRVIFLVILACIFLPCMAQAGEIDGIWWNPESGLDAGLVMIRENSGTVLAVALEIDDYWDNPHSEVLIGNKTGNTIRLFDTFTCPVYMDVTVNLTSPTKGEVKINWCKPKNDRYFCIYPSGVRFDIEKVF